MAINIMALPAVRAAEGTDFTPLNRAISNFAQQRDEKYAEEQRLENQQYQRGIQQEQLGRQRESHDMDMRKKRVDQIAGIAQMIDKEADPNKRAMMWQNTLRVDPKLASSLPENARDPMNGPKFLLAEARGFVDPTTEAIKQAQLRQLQGPQPRNIKEVNGRLVEVGPNGVRTIYEAPNPIQEMLLQRLKGSQQQAPGLPPSAGAPPASPIQKQSMDGQVMPGGVTLTAGDQPQGAAQPAPAAPQRMVQTPFGEMTPDEARQMGGAMLLDPKYQAAGRAILDSIKVDENVGIGKVAANQLDERVTGSAGTLGRLQTIKQQFRPEFAQIPSKLQLLGASWTSAMGMKLPPDLEKNLGDFSRFKSSAFNNFNTLLKELSGTAVTAQELERLKLELPNPGNGIFDGDDPVSFMSKLANGEKLARAAIARANFMQTRGLRFDRNSLDKFMSLDDVPAAIDRRGAEIEAQIRQTNPRADPMAIQKQTLDQLKREFGI